MAYLGLQPAGDPPSLGGLDAALAVADGPGHHDRAIGDGEIVTAAYWSDPATIDLDRHRRRRARMYLNDVEPVLKAGMEFLRDEGESVGCYANRYVTVMGGERSYGMSWWRSLDALERWSESHPTHLAIFGAAMRYLPSMGPAARLRLYHEVSVLPANGQLFEYVDCRPGTGLAVNAHPAQHS